MTAGTAEKTLRSEDELRELAASGAHELGAELDADVAREIRRLLEAGSEQDSTTEES